MCRWETAGSTAAERWCKLTRELWLQKDCLWPSVQVGDCTQEGGL